jgi:hypothetical protein
MVPLQIRGEELEAARIWFTRPPEHRSNLQMPTEIAKAVGTGVADPHGKTTSSWEVITEAVGTMTSADIEQEVLAERPKRKRGDPGWFVETASILLPLIAARGAVVSALGLSRPASKGDLRAPLLSKTEPAVKTSEAAVKTPSNVKKKIWCALRGLKCKEYHAEDIRFSYQETFEHLLGTLMYAGIVISLAISAFATIRRMYRWGVLQGIGIAGAILALVYT